VKHAGVLIAMNEQLTRDARKVMQLANQEAHRFKQSQRKKDALIAEGRAKS